MHEFCKYFAKIQRYRPHFWQKKCKICIMKMEKNVRKIRFRFEIWIVRNNFNTFLSFESLEKCLFSQKCIIYCLLYPDGTNNVNNNENI